MTTWYVTRAGGIVAFAPGLVGYGFVALLTRALYAAHRARAVTIAGLAGWLVVIGTDVALARALPPTRPNISMPTPTRLPPSARGRVAPRRLRALPSR